jgi:hypothetical protein
LFTYFGHICWLWINLCTNFGCLHTLGQFIYILWTNLFTYFGPICLLWVKLFIYFGRICFVYLWANLFTFGH